jgi:hypothetical protein
MPISHDAFAKRMTKALRKAGVDHHLHYDAERFAIVSDKAGEFFLASAHQLYAEASFWRRGAVLKHYAQTMFNAQTFAVPKTFDEARGNLVPVVRNAAYLDVSELLARTSPSASAPRPPSQFLPLAGTLCYGLAYDSPQTLLMFSAQQLTEWSVTFDDAMKAARYNLSVRSRDPMTQISPGLYMAPWQDANAAGRLVLTELLTRIPVKGDVVAAAPGRDFLFVTGSDDAKALGALVLAMEKAVADPKPNTPEMFRLEGTSWTPFKLPDDHPFTSRHRALVEGFIASDYEKQKELINQLNDKSGVDVFVASYTPMQRKNGEIYSWCSWAPCVSLLPRTELVAIFDADAMQGDQKQPVMVKWQDAFEVVGHRMKRQNEYRFERYLVEESPTESEMVELRRRAVSL